jgi:NADH-quinone oxidoreductase subunit H
MEAMLQPVADFFGPSWTAIWTLLKIVAIIAAAADLPSPT